MNETSSRFFDKTFCFEKDNHDEFRSNSQDVIQPWGIGINNANRPQRLESLIPTGKRKALIVRKKNQQKLKAKIKQRTIKKINLLQLGKQADQQIEQVDAASQQRGPFKIQSNTQKLSLLLRQEYEGIFKCDKALTHTTIQTLRDLRKITELNKQKLIKNASSRRFLPFQCEEKYLFKNSHGFQQNQIRELKFPSVFNGLKIKTNTLEPSYSYNIYEKCVKENKRPLMGLKVRQSHRYI